MTICGGIKPIMSQQNLGTCSKTPRNSGTIHLHVNRLKGHATACRKKSEENGFLYQIHNFWRQNSQENR